MEIQEKFNELYNLMATSGDPAKMHVFGSAEQWLMGVLAKNNPELAKKWVEKVEAVKWNNYLCESDAMAIVAKFVNRDGSQGGKWSHQQIVSAVQELGGNICHEPYYNEHALFVAMNWIASNSWPTIVKFVPEEHTVLATYALAVDLLTDPDEPHFLSRYWK
jgi:hypothetical protein